MKINMIVLTNTELGWDCVIGVYHCIEEAVNAAREQSEISDGQENPRQWLEERCFVFHEQYLEVEL